jgi:hypothetical protein
MSTRADAFHANMEALSDEVLAEVGQRIENRGQIAERFKSVADRLHAAMLTRLTDADMAEVERQLYTLEQIADRASPPVRWNVGVVHFEVLETPVFLVQCVDGPQVGDIAVVCRQAGKLGGKIVYQSGTGDLFTYDGEKRAIEQIQDSRLAQELIATKRALSDLKSEVARAVHTVIDKTLDEGFDGYALKRLFGGGDSE